MGGVSLQSVNRYVICLGYRHRFLTNKAQNFVSCRRSWVFNCPFWIKRSIFRSSLSLFLTHDDKESNIKFICYKNKKSCNLLTRTLLEQVTQNSTEFTLWKTVIRNEQMSVMASSANIGRGEDKKFQYCFVYNS